MNFSKKSRYGLRALIDLTVYSKESHVALAAIAERNSISPQYLEQVFAALRKAGIIKSVKGPQGGYLLAKPATKISVAEILRALEGDYLIEEEDVEGAENGRAAAQAVQSEVIERLTEDYRIFLRICFSLTSNKNIRNTVNTVKTCTIYNRRNAHHQTGRLGCVFFV